jgi:hypothetical protein
MSRSLAGSMMFPFHGKVRGLDQKFLFNYISIEVVFTNNRKEL